jgi:uncharacterized protein
VAFRHETFRVDAQLVKQMPDGSVRIPAHLTKPGVFTYTTADGQKVREYRPPEEVAKADGYEDAHITIGHPPRGVGPDSYSRLNVGHVRASTVKTDAAGVDAEVVLRRKDAIEGALSGKLHDLSCGYGLQIDPTPGVTPSGEPYDRVQRNIVVNHVALLARGDGRLGTDCALRLDGADEQIVDGDVSVDSEDPALAKKRAGLKAKYGDSMKTKIRQDGKEVEVEAGSAEHLAFLEAEAADARKRADAADGRLAAVDAAAAVGRREALVTQALAHGVACVRKDGDKEVALTEREIKVAVVAKRIDSAFTGKNADGSDCSAAYLDGMYAAATKADATKAAPAIAAGLNGGTTEAHADSNDGLKDIEKLVTDSADAWKVK